MLTRDEIERLLGVVKQLSSSDVIKFPAPGEKLKIEAKSIDGRDFFLIDVNRHSRIQLSKCTYQNRYAVVEILLRLDVGGPMHVNPDGDEVPCPHLHIYREGFGDKWAISLPSEFSDSRNLVKTLQEFLRYCKVTSIPQIQQTLN